jgi:hypothetical protein
MTACTHENADHLKAGDSFVPHSSSGLDMIKHVAVEQLRCLDCGAWLGLGDSNDVGRRVTIEIAAARLIAGYEDANDTDDTLDDPIAREVLRHMVGEANVKTKRARDAFQIHVAWAIS